MTRSLLTLFAVLSLMACGNTPQSQYAEQVIKSETQYDDLNVRDYTSAPMGIEIAIQLNVSPAKAMEIVTDFDDYPSWVSPAPKNVIVDNSRTEDGEFGVGSLVSYTEGEMDKIVAYKPGFYMMAQPQTGPAAVAFEGHHGLVLVKSDGNGGSILHMRRYFEPVGFQGWIVSKLMPIFMNNSAKNLIKIHGGELIHKR